VWKSFIPSERRIHLIGIGAVIKLHLDQFMRKVKTIFILLTSRIPPDIDEIPRTEHKTLVVLPPAERAISLGLKHHLDALDMVLKKTKLRSQSDREKRLQESLDQSDSAEEALLKRCSHLISHKSSNNVPKQCDVIVEERTRQLRECKEELCVVLQEAQLLHQSIARGEDEDSHYERWLRVTNTTGVGDADATQ
jgi:hypothetical protein